MNVAELLGELQAQHDEITAHAGELRDPIAHLTTAPAETEGRLPDLATTRKVIAEPAPTEASPIGPRRTRPTRPS